MLDDLRRHGSTALHLVLLGAGTVISTSCGGDPATPNIGGTIQVAAKTEGTDFDTDGYLATLNSQSIAIFNLDTIWFTEVEPGTYQVGLGGIAENCTTVENPRSVEVTPGDTVKTDFTVTCDVPAPPPGGPGENPR